MENPHKICEKCKDPTKRPIGFWDGYENGRMTHGFLYSCSSLTCPIALERTRAEAEELYRKSETRIENANNGIHVGRFRALRRQADLIIGDVAKLIGASPSEVSAWENERKPFPPAIYDQLIREFERRIRGEQNA